MNKSISILASLALAFFITPATVHADEADALEGAVLVDQIVIKVNESVVTASELQSFLAPELSKAQERYGRDPERLRQEVRSTIENVIDQVIEFSLLEQEAAASDIVVDPASVEAAIRSVMEENKVPDRETFEAQLKAMGMTYDEYKEDLELQMKVMRFRNREFSRYLTVLDSEVEQYYRENQDEFMGIGEADIKWFQVPVGVDGEASLNTANELRRQAEIDGNWDELVAKHSVGPNRSAGGSLGRVQQDQIQDIFSQAIFALDGPSITSVIEHEGHYHFFKVDELKPAAVAPLEEVQEPLRNFIRERKTRERLETWLEDVYEKSYIKVYEDRIYPEVENL